MQPVWRELIRNFEVPAKPASLWTLVVEYVGPSRKLRFKASGTWAYQDPSLPAPAAPAAAPPAAGDNTRTGVVSADEKRECGPDGDLWIPPPADALSQDAFIGALIGKIGGSSAAIKNTSAFAVGSFCVVDVTDTTKGPLYLTINDVPGGIANNSGTLSVSIWEALS